MGLVKKTSVDQYWSTNKVLQTPFLGEVMSRTRFQQHQSCLHLVDNTKVARTDDGKLVDKLAKVRPLLDSFVKSSSRHFSPGRELSIDEMMIGTKCRLGFIQYMKDKPVKWGIKVWALCDAKVHYCLDFEVYTGGTGETGMTFNVVNRLMRQYLEKGHRLYIDNFYTSPELLVHLLAYHTLAVGTVRSNRKHMPARLKPTITDVEVGQTRFLQSHGVTVSRWKDKRDVFVASTVHGKSLTEVTRRAKKDGRYQVEVVQKPTAVCDYNANMIGVDVFDQMLAYRDIVRRYMRWWLNVFWRLIDIAILNAFALWKLKHYPEPAARPHSKHLHMQFRLALAQSLVRAQVEERGGVHQAPRNQRTNPLKHHCCPTKFETAKQCVVCNKVSSKTFYGCSLCDEQVRVHPNTKCAFFLHTSAQPREAFAADNR